MASVAPKSYPRVSGKVWWALRDEFKRSFPKTVDAAYLSSKLGLSQGSAGVVIANLRTIGVIDEFGKPTQLANLWRDDQGYKEACDQILTKIFPEVVGAFPPPEVDRSQLQRWFASTTGTGENAARQMAAFYELVASADHSRKPEKDDAPPKKPKSPSHKITKGASNGRASIAQVETVVLDQNKSATASPSLPTLHIDIQIHLAADAPDNQIQSLFKNMAKYIYGKAMDE